MGHVGTGEATQRYGSLVNMDERNASPKRLDELPEELKDHVLCCLDPGPPSVVENASEPDLPKLFSNDAGLKNLSLTSKSWFAKVRPILHTHLRISVEELQCLSQDLVRFGSADDHNKPGDLYDLGSRLWFSNSDRASFKASLLEGELEKSIKLRLEDGKIEELSWNDLTSQDATYVDTIMDHLVTIPNEEERSRHAGRASAFVDFIKHHGLRDPPVSLLVYTEVDFQKEANSRDPRPTAGRPMFWNHIFECLNIERLVIVASPATVASLTSCFADMADEWAFDIPYQRVELSLPPGGKRSRTIRPNSRNTISDEREAAQTQAYNQAADSFKTSVLYKRHWDSFEYDEGASLSAYGTYHYFEKVCHCRTNVSCIAVYISCNLDHYVSSL